MARQWDQAGLWEGEGPGCSGAGCSRAATQGAQNPKVCIAPSDTGGFSNALRASLGSTFKYEKCYLKRRVATNNNTACMLEREKHNQTHHSASSWTMVLLGKGTPPILCSY
eukprot:1139788-Pelagomonas_calceolata.AAC.4